MALGSIAQEAAAVAVGVTLLARQDLVPDGSPPQRVRDALGDCEGGLPIQQLLCLVAPGIRAGRIAWASGSIN